MRFGAADPGGRLIALGLLAAGLAGIWQVLPLRTWTFTGPGPGLFPQILAGLCIGLSLLELVRPRPAVPFAAFDETEGEGPPGVAERRTFLVYVAGLFVMCAGVAFAGFGLTTMALMALILRFGEGRSWPAALGYGLAWTLIGWLVFGRLLGINMPEGPLDTAFLRLVR